MDVRDGRRRLFAAAVLPALLACLAVPVAGQSIFTVAGGGSTDQQSATAVTLRDVRGLAVDTAGNIYFSEFDGHVVQRIDPAAGTIGVYAGNGGGSFGGDGGLATRAALKGPQGLAFDSDGNLYIADHDNNRIRKVDAKSGTISTVAEVDVTISSTAVGMPMPPSRSTYPARVTIELLVAKRTATRSACSHATSSRAPGIGSFPR